MENIKINYPLNIDGTVNIDKWAKDFALRKNLTKVELLKTAGKLVQQYSKNCNTPYSNSCDYPGLLVAEILSSLKLDVDTILLGIIYYAYTYANLTMAVIQENFGDELILLIKKLQQLDQVAENSVKVNSGSVAKDTIYNLRNMLVAIVGDIRIVLLKLAIHTNNMRLVVGQNNQLQQDLAYEAREIYAPLANRLGVGWIKKELEDLAFKFLEPEAYAEVINFLAEGKINREEYIAEAIKQLQFAFTAQPLQVELQGRVKHLYSIWKKIQNKMLTYYEVYDIHAVRVLVDTVADCYVALGVVHMLWKHIPKEFDDYIACPKSNGYQSLHTTVIGPYGKILEVQIRTKEMHKFAELGIAAHWRYKEGGKTSNVYEDKINYLRQIIAWQLELTSEVELVEALKTELFADRIYVFTPKGDIVDLPQGATAIDLAYYIHTDIGHRCRGAKANGKIIPISQPLVTGMQVEILTVKEGGPSRDWLTSHIKYLVTSKAKAKIHQWFRQQDKEQNLQLGREIIQREFRRLGLSKVNLKELAATIINANNEEDLLAGLGSGEIRITKVFEALQQLHYIAMPKIKHEQLKIMPTAAKAANNDVIMIDGLGGLTYHLAKCCNPTMQDEIIGYITLGNGVAVHKKDCVNILQHANIRQNRLLQVTWSHGQDNYYFLNVVIKAYDRKGLLRDITTVLANEDVDVIDIKAVAEQGQQIVTINIRIKLTNLAKLSSLLFRVQNIANVIEAQRAEDKS